MEQVENRKNYWILILNKNKKRLRSLGLLFVFEKVFGGFMRVLDIDMDFFKKDICYDKIDSDEFLQDDNIPIWESEKIQCFLEERCGLGNNHKIKGRIIKHHIEAYSFGEELIKEGKIITPIEVTHIDAHIEYLCMKSISQAYQGGLCLFKYSNKFALSDLNI